MVRIGSPGIGFPCREKGYTASWLHVGLEEDDLATGAGADARTLAMGEGRG